MRFAAETSGWPPGRWVIVVTLLVATACSGDGTARSTTTATAVTTATTLAATTAARPSTVPEESAAALVARDCDVVPGLPPARCFWLEVPERRDVDGSPTIRLWVEVVTPDGTPPDALPLVWLTGGPGDAASAIVGRVVARMGSRRPHVFVDQRGTGQSQPRLDCEEADQLFIDPTLAWPQRLAEARAIAQTCRDRLVAAGIDLAAYNTAEDASDLVELRRALGYPRWEVYGVSYGGRLAQQLLRRDEAGVAAVILDSSITSEPLGAASLVTRADDAVGRLAAACRAQPGCAAANPDVRASFDAAVRQLDEHPFTTSATDVDGTPLVVSGQEVVAGTFQAMYDRDLLAVLPGALAAIAGGDTGIIDTLASTLVSRQGDRAAGLLAASLCADDGAAVSAADQAVLADPGDHGTLLLNWPYPVCDVWAVPAVPDGPLVAPASDVPVLLLEGALDPVAPPRFADTITAHLTHATVIVMPAGGHGNILANECVTGIAGAFLDDPTAPPSTSCVAALPAPFAS